MSASTVPMAATIQIAHHQTVTFLGLSLHIDTIWSTAAAGLVVIILGLFLRSQVTSGVPGKVQIFWESLITWITGLVEQNLGRVNPFVVPLGVSLFIFILISNWLELIPTNDHLPAPTADVNLTYALALLVIVGVHVYSIRERGFGGYVRHYFQPSPYLFLLNLIEEIVKPFTLALRLFGNIFSGGIMIALIGLLPSYILWGPTALWKLFDMFIGGIQAFIFALLTIIYFGMAGASSHGDDHAHSASDEAAAPAH